MLTGLQPFIFTLTVLFFIDFFVLGLVRKSRLPDFLAHIIAGIFLGLLFPDIKNIYPQNDLSLYNGYSFLAALGLFSFFFEFGRRTHLHSYKIAELSSFKDVSIYTITIIILFFLTGPIIFGKNVGIEKFIFLSIPFIGADLTILVIGNENKLADLQSDYLDFIKFTLALEIISIMLFAIFSIGFLLNIYNIHLKDLFIILLTIPAFYYLVFSKIPTQQENIFIHWSYLFIIIGILLGIFYVTTLIGISLPIRGLFCGIIFQLAVMKIRYFQRFLSGTIFKFFIIFPFVLLGILLTKKMQLVFIFFDTLVILFVLLISSCAIGMFWIKRQNQVFNLMFALLHRGEFTLLLLLWAYIYNLVNLEFIAGAILLSLIISFISRFKILEKDSK
jgi:hypothetical protein